MVNGVDASAEMIWKMSLVPVQAVDGYRISWVWSRARDARRDQRGFPGWLGHEWLISVRGRLSNLGVFTASPRRAIVEFDSAGWLLVFAGNHESRFHEGGHPDVGDRVLVHENFRWTRTEFTQFGVVAASVSDRSWHPP